MTIAELIASRENDWRALEELVRDLQKPTILRKQSPDAVARFAALYRAVSADLALAESYQLPPNVIERLNELVGRAHSCLYRRVRDNSKKVWATLFLETPRWIITDVSFWIALALFWIPYLVCFSLARVDSNFAYDVVGEGQIRAMTEMYSNSLSGDIEDRIPMFAFYVMHNSGIGLKCFAFGLLGCFPGALTLLSNSVQLGTVTGFMSSPACPSVPAANFFEFTRAHGPCELTAIVLSAAAGMRIGFSLIATRGYSRLDALRRAAIQATPTVSVALVLFCVAAFLEGFVSPSPLDFLKSWFGDGAPLMFKRAIEWGTALALFFYFFVLGGISIQKHYGVGFYKRVLNGAIRKLTFADVSLERVETRDMKTARE